MTFTPMRTRAMASKHSTPEGLADMMNEVLTPHYARELRRVRRKKSIAQLRKVVIGLGLFMFLPIGVIVLLGYLGV